jgi:hypothetical protein
MRGMVLQGAESKLLDLVGTAKLAQQWLHLVTLGRRWTLQEEMNRKILLIRAPRFRIVGRIHLLFCASADGGKRCCQRRGRLRPELL